MKRVGMATWITQLAANKCVYVYITTEAMTTALKFIMWPTLALNLAKSMQSPSNKILTSKYQTSRGVVVVGQLNCRW